MNDKPYLQKHLRGHRNKITSLFYSPNETQIASGSMDNSILLWDLKNENPKSYRFQGHEGPVMDVTFSPTGKYMASVSADKTVRLWVPTATGSTGMFKAHSQSIRSVQFTSDASKIVTASNDRMAKMWNTESFKIIRSFVGHRNWVNCARVSMDGSVIASCSDDKSAKLWSPDTPQVIHSYKEEDVLGCLSWHPSGTYIAVGSSTGAVKFYDIRTHMLVQFYRIHSGPVTSLSFHPSGNYVMTASKDGKVKILDVLEGHPIFTLTAHTGSVNATNFSPSGDNFVTAGDDKLVHVWKTNFTRLFGETEDNLRQSSEKLSQSSRSLTKGKKQDPRHWYLCYHGKAYPVTTFVYIDDESNITNINESETTTRFEEPNANSTMIDHRPEYENAPISAVQSNPSTYTIREEDSSRSLNRFSFGVGHISHIPRTPPSPAAITMPSVLNKSVGVTTLNYEETEDIFGMIKLKENDVCYTSGTIEWVGRKRGYPLNSGFKLLHESEKMTVHEACLSKKLKRSDVTFTINKDGGKDCNCADVLPTVSAIVDHLNALHEAVDIADLRLSTLEESLTKNK